LGSLPLADFKLKVERECEKYGETWGKMREKMRKIGRRVGDFASLMLCLDEKIKWKERKWEERMLI
jgi:hypothetical protein